MDARAQCIELCFKDKKISYMKGCSFKKNTFELFHTFLFTTPLCVMCYVFIVWRTSVRIYTVKNYVLEFPKLMVGAIRTVITTNGREQK